jgi:hypothetical protein
VEEEEEEELVLQSSKSIISPSACFCEVLLQATTALVSLQTKCVTENPF